MAHRHPYQPTRLCPHRYCPPLHILSNVLGYAFIVLSLPTIGLSAFLIVVGVGVVELLIARIIHRRTLRQLVHQVNLDKALGFQLVPRPGWTALAVVLDALDSAAVITAISFTFADPAIGQIQWSSTTATCAVVLAMCFLAIRQYAHKQATRPGQPKRLQLPALTKTSS